MHCDRTNSDLLIAADSIRRSLLLSVRRLSSEPARSMAEAVLSNTMSPVVCVTLTRRMACERELWALSLVAAVTRLLLAST